MEEDFFRDNDGEYLTELFYVRIEFVLYPRHVVRNELESLVSATTLQLNDRKLESLSDPLFHHISMIFFYCDNELKQFYLYEQLCHIQTYNDRV